MNITKAHGMLGHGGKDSARLMVKHMGWIIARGKMKPYIHCAKSKSKQKNVSKASQSPKATEPGRCVYLDLSKVTVSRNNGLEFELK